jgi:hypothetical protein
MNLSAKYDAMLERMQEPGARERMQKAFNATPQELAQAALEFARRQAMEIKRRKVVIERFGSDRVVEIYNGPFKMFANDPNEYYEGWMLPESQDPYGEPYTVIFTKESIKREA